MRLREAAPDAEFVWREIGKTVEEDIRDAEVMVGNFDPAILPAAKNVRLYQAGTAGVDPLVKPGVLPGETRICSAVGAYNYCVAEHMLAQTLACLRHFPELRDAQQRREWVKVPSNGTLRACPRNRQHRAGLRGILRDDGRACDRVPPPRRAHAGRGEGLHDGRTG